MEVISNTTDFLLEKETAVAIGKFDGIHIGHRRLLEEIISRKSKELNACVFTFDPPPAFVFAGEEEKKLTVLSTKEEKRILFERMGVDILIEFPLNMETASIPPRAFAADILSGRMNVRFLAAGRDLSFGAKGEGDAALLREMAPLLGFEFLAINKVCVEGEEVSSTLVRSYVEKGNLEAVQSLLGMPYLIAGKAHPQVNPSRFKVYSEEIKLLPPDGSYVSQVRHKGKIYNAVSSVKDGPDGCGEVDVCPEPQSYDFWENICGESVEIYLLKKY